MGKQKISNAQAKVKPSPSKIQARLKQKISNAQAKIKGFPTNKPTKEQHTTNAVVATLRRVCNGNTDKAIDKEI